MNSNRQDKQVELYICRAETKHLKNKFNYCKSDSDATWKVVEDIVPGLRRNNKNTFFDELLKMAEEFNQYFASVGETAVKSSQLGVVSDIMK